MKSLYKVFVPEGITPELEQILYSGNLTSGKFVKEFESKVQHFLGAAQFLAVNNYNAAATIVWELVGINAGDEVIASPMSCLASNQPLALKKAAMKWTDIDPLSGSLDPVAVRKNITGKTKAILHYHWGGYPGYIDEILAIGKEFGIPVIEDAIESFGAEYKGKKLGNTGADYTLFSFQPVRLPTTIDGGGIVCKNAEDYKKALLLRDYGIDRTQFRDAYGEISASCDIALPGLGAFIGTKAMDSVEELLKMQRQNAIENKSFLEQFKKVKPIGIPDILPNYWIYTFLSEDRDTLLQAIRTQDLYASKVHIRNDYYSVFGPFDDQLTGVKEFNDKTLSIPSGWWLNKL